MKLLDAQLAAGVKINAAQFARDHGVHLAPAKRTLLLGAAATVDAKASPLRA